MKVISVYFDGRKFVAIMTFICFIFAIVTGCTSSLSTKEGVISGQVALFGEEYHSGITVLIYRAEVIPSEVLDLNHKYPEFTVETDCRDWFDHRQMNALDQVFTDSAGNFSFKKRPFGEYIVAFYKEGWGFGYEYDINLSMKEQNITEAKKLFLYPEQEIPNYIDGVYEFEADRCYIAKNDIILSENGSLVFHDNSRVMLDRNVKISIYGTVICPTDDCKAYVTSSLGIYSGIVGDQSRGEGIIVHAQANDWHNLVFSSLQNALTTSVNDSFIRGLSFVNCHFGLLTKFCNNVEVKNSLFANNNINNTIAVSAYSVNGHVLKENIFFNNYMGYQNRITVDSVARNNIFMENNKGFSNELESDCILDHNSFIDNVTGIENSGASNLSITFNEIEGYVAIRTYYAARTFNTVERGWTKANNNNILARLYAVESLAYYIYNDGPYPLDFKNNYWGTTDTDRINRMIIDYYDLGLEGYLASVNSVVEYVPFKSNIVPEAGININYGKN